MDNIIYVFKNKDNKWILKFPKCNIEVSAYIDKYLKICIGLMTLNLNTIIN